MKNLLKEKLVRVWQFIKAQIESYRTTIFANKIKPECDKIEVVFVVYFSEAFSSFQALYEMLRCDDSFSVHILCQPSLKSLDKNDSYLFLSEYYAGVINAYENSKWYDLKKLAPDYVFYCRPYNPDYYEEYKSSVVRKYAKICFITYAYNLENKRDYNFNFVNNYDFLQNCYYIFASTEYEKNILQKRFVLSSILRNYPKILFVGFPRFDLYFNKKEKLLSKQDKPFTILYTPRWTSYKKIRNQESSFLLYIDNFMNYAKLNSDVQIIIRPHPLMMRHYITENIVSPDFFDKLEKSFLQIGNIHFDKTKDYFDSLDKADVFVSDYTSLLVEYFVSGKPVIYLGKINLFNKDAKKMCSSFYRANSWNEIKNFIENIKFGFDSLKIKRNKIFQKIIKNYGKSARNIFDILKNNPDIKGEL